MNENRNNSPMNPEQLRQQEVLELENKAVEKMLRQQERFEQENKAAEKMLRQQERFERKSTAAAQKTLRQIRELSHKPDAIEPFLETLESIFSDNVFVAFPRLDILDKSVPAILLVFSGAPIDIKASATSYSSFVIGSI